MVFLFKCLICLLPACIESHFRKKDTYWRQAVPDLTPYSPLLSATCQPIWEDGSTVSVEAEQQSTLRVNPATDGAQK